jgi:hypothetical protein
MGDKVAIAFDADRAGEEQERSPSSRVGEQATGRRRTENEVE